MKSRRHELKELLNKPNIVTNSPSTMLQKDIRQLTKPNAISAKESKIFDVDRMHKQSGRTLDNTMYHRPNKQMLLSEYAEFKKRSGMIMESEMSSDKLNIKDIIGASPFIKQLSSKEPIKTLYDKNETFQNYKTTFLQRRAKAKNYDSKRCMRIADIDGAVPKKTKSITESRRIKLTSSDLRDLITDINNFRKK